MKLKHIAGGVKSAGFSVLVNTQMTSSLVECGFISNEVEVKNISNSEYQDKLATGIANGIESYLKNNIILQQQNPHEEIISTEIVTAESLNVRSGYGTSYSKIGGLLKGSKVQILATQNGWYKILFNDGYGYISGNYVDIDEDMTQKPPEENDKIVFSDIKDHWAKDQIKTFVDQGYIDGYEDNTFIPNASITREEVADIITSIKNNKVENLDKIFKYVDYEKISD